MISTVALKTVSASEPYLSQESADTAKSVSRLLLLGREMADSTSWIESEGTFRMRDVEERFNELAQKWREECAHLSSVREMVLHPAYQHIVGMGKDAIPFLLRELERQPDHWFWALWAITQENPVPPEHRGRVPEMAQDWLEWARRKGIIW